VEGDGTGLGRQRRSQVRASGEKARGKACGAHGEDRRPKGAVRE